MRTHIIPLVIAVLTTSALFTCAQETRPATNAPARRAQSPPVVSPELLSNGGVTFRFKAPKANEVKASGQFGPDIAMTKEAHFTIKAADTSRARCWRLTWLAYDNKPPSNDWERYVAPSPSKARKAADRGLKAMARFRKALAAHRLPIVNFTAIGANPLGDRPSAVVNSPTVTPAE